MVGITLVNCMKLDPWLRNQEGHTALDLATADDVRCLLSDAMTTHQSFPVATKTGNKIILPNISSDTQASYLGSGDTKPETGACAAKTQDNGISNETVIMPSGNKFLLPIRSLLSSDGGDGETESTNSRSTSSSASALDVEVKSQIACVSNFLSSLRLDHLKELFENEQITLEILAEMSHEDLKGIGVVAYGHRHILLKGIDRIRSSMGGGTILIELPRDDREFIAVDEEMHSTIRSHRDNGVSGGTFTRYHILKVSFVHVFH